MIKFLSPLFILLASLPLYGEGEEDDTLYEEVIEEEAMDPAMDAQTAAFDPESPSDVTALRAQVASLTQKLQALEGHVKRSQPAPPQNQGNTITDPDVLDLMQEIGATTEEQAQGALEAHTKAEATAMAHARKSAGTLPTGSTQSEFDTLHKLYNEAIQAGEGPTFVQRANTFKTACGQYIERHQTDSSSRSALYYLGRVLLKQNQLKDAQNAFARVYRGDEQGPHAADSLLGMSKVLIKQGNKSAAIKFLEKIKKDFKPDYLSTETKADFKVTAKDAGSTLSLESLSHSKTTQAPIKNTSGPAKSTQTLPNKVAPAKTQKAS